MTGSNGHTGRGVCERSRVAVGRKRKGARCNRSTLARGLGGDGELSLLKSFQAAHRLTVRRPTNHSVYSESALSLHCQVYYGHTIRTFPATRSGVALLYWWPW